MPDSREYPSRPIVGVGVVVQKDDLVLLIQRGQEPGRGMWSIPGGTVELGERLEEAAAREVREECGVEINVGDAIEAFDLILRDDSARARYHYVIVDFAARYVSGNVQARSDVMDARWVVTSELGQYALNEKTREVIGRAFRRGTRKNISRVIASPEGGKQSESKTRRLLRRKHRSGSSQ